MARWVYRLSDGLISHKCLYPDATKTSTVYGIITLPDDVQLNVELERIDPVTQEVRAATPEELLARQQEVREQEYKNDSRREDILTMIAFTVRRDMGPAQFDALTAVQKRNLILQQADVWRTIRATIQRSDFL